MAVAYSNPRFLNTYQNNSVMGLTPGQLVLKMYDMTVVSLKSRDGARASRVLAYLIECLDFKYEVADGLFRLYRYCMEQIKEGQYEVPTKIMAELRDSWVQALDRA